MRTPTAIWYKTAVNSPRPDTLRRIRRFDPNWIGLAVLVLAFGVCLYRVMMVHARLVSPDQTVIRIAHWQLEAGYREAMQSVIDDYEKVQADRFRRGEIPNPVRVIQMPITERVYAQWLNAHLIGGDAPDLVEMGASRMVTNDLCLVRYFVPMTDLVDRPNPYNRGTQLESVAWRDTFIDGMHGKNQYRENLQDYYAICTTLSTNRLFYNKDLFRRASGTGRLPESFGELMTLCRQIRALPNNGQPLIPISACSYNFRMVEFLNKYLIPFTASFEKDLDTDLNGQIEQNEVYAGFVRGQVNFQSPAIQAYYQCLKELCDQFPTGFSAMDRQQSAFLFVQGKAAMLVGGSWDAESLARQARGKFELGVMDFPLPRPGEKYGEFIAGRANEVLAVTGGGFGVYRMSHNQPAAIDFLQFLTSQRYNEKLNAQANWFPVILGSRPSALMQPFAPDPSGYVSKVDFAYGTSLLSQAPNTGSTLLSQMYSGQLWRFLQGEIGYDEFARNVETALRNPTYGGDRSWAIEHDLEAKNCRNAERVLAVQAVRELMDPGAGDATRKLHQGLLQQIRWNNAEDMRYRFESMRHQPMPDP